MSYDFIEQIITNNILIHMEASIQKCSKLVVKTWKSKLEAQNKSP